MNMRRKKSAGATAASHDGTACRERWIRLAVWLLRIAIGGVFVFSGFVKSVDPWGTIYKFDDYLAALGIALWPNLVVVGTFALCGFEFLTGVFLMLGIYRRSSPVMAATLMAVMLPLTLWVAVSDPVADCGCFGDAVVLSNWATFWKNVALSVAIAALVALNRRAGCLVTPYMQWVVFIATGLYVVVIGLYGYICQPLIDFRPYPIGSELVSTDEEEYEPQYIFIYEKDGARQEFGADEVPDEADGWSFIDRRELPARAEQDADTDSKTLSVWSADGNEDVTYEVLAPHGAQLILFIPELAEVSPASTYRINSLYTWAQRNGVEMLAIVSGSEQEIAEWSDLSMPSYPIYTADDTSIKEIVRGNPGVVYVEDGHIKWKNSLRALQVDDFLDSGTRDDPMAYAVDFKRVLYDITGLYIAVMAVPMVLSFFPALRGVFSRRMPRLRFRHRRRGRHNDV